MAINVEWEDENGTLIEAWGDYLLPWDRSMFYKTELLEKTCCLRFIDHYGDTTFNQSQIPVLADELEMIEKYIESTEQKRGIDSLIAFLRKAEGHIHTYVKFYGD